MCHTARCITTTQTSPTWSNRPPCTDAADFGKRALELAAVSNDRSRRPNRLERMDVLGVLRLRPRLAEAIARAQHEITAVRAIAAVLFPD